MDARWQPSLENALRSLAEGRFVIVAHERGADSEGVLVLAAGKATRESLRFLASRSSLPLSVVLTEERLQELRIPPLLPTHDPSALAGRGWLTPVGVRSGANGEVPLATIRALADRRTRP